MNKRESESLDRYITGNYGEDQFKDSEEEQSEPNKAPWLVRPDYGKENVYRLWDENSNYHEDTSPETMDANAALMSAAPLLRAALQALYDAIPTGYGDDRSLNEALGQTERVLGMVKP